MAVPKNKQPMFPLKHFKETLRLATILRYLDHNESVRSLDFSANLDPEMATRNKFWVEKFVSQKGNSLVIVGNSHLVGSRSVLELLQEEGFSISSVKLNLEPPSAEAIARHKAKLKDLYEQPNPLFLEI